MSDGPLLGPETVSWRVNHEPAVFMGGGRALLLQVAHPLVAAGVEQHSGYREDPWGRLYRTLDTTLKIAFGDGPTSRAASKKLRRRHDTVKGTAEDGTPYDAQDPTLLLWVWATLVDTSLLLYGRCLEPLSVAERERFYSEQKLFAHACGVPEGACPEGFAEFSEYFERTVAEDVEVGDAARAVADSIVDPQVARPLRPLAAPNNLVTLGLLPPAVRDAYGYEWGPASERRLRLLLRAARAGHRVAPRGLRHLPASAVSNGRTGWLERRFGAPRPRARAV